MLILPLLLSLLGPSSYRPRFAKREVPSPMGPGAARMGARTVKATAAAAVGPGGGGVGDKVFKYKEKTKMGENPPNQDSTGALQ